MTSIQKTLLHRSGRPARHKIALVVTTLLTVFITYATLTPMATPQGLPGSDKTYHVLAFVALTFPCAVLYPRTLILVFPGAIAFGGLIEIIQPYFGREREMADLYADAVGASIGVGAGLCLRSILKKLM